jgi:hypothetical protein
MQGLAKQSIFIMFTSFLFERLIHYRQYYSTEAEFVKHLMSGEVKITIPDIIQFQNEYEHNRPSLPSTFQIDQVVSVQFKKGTYALNATVRGVHFYRGKVKYDLGLWLGDGSVDDPETETRIYNIDSVYVHVA